MDSSRGCDTSKSPWEDPCVVDESVGVFVDAKAVTDAGGALGTKTSPFATLGAGLVAAKASGKRVYVCGGTYAESLFVDSSLDGAAVFGGFVCGTWTYDATNTVTVKPASGAALRVSQVTSARFVDMELEAANATGLDHDGAGRSSIAAFVASSVGVRFVRVSLKSGKGADASPATTAQNYTNGATANGGALRIGGTALCANGDTSSGGNGGITMSPAASNPGGNGQSKPPVVGVGIRDGRGGLGSTTVPPADCTNGHFGADGAAGIAGAGAGTLGALSAAGWAPVAGSRGGTGSPGQGGGGGGGSTDPVLDGTGGGAGGCGGAGGAAGKGGGGSIALLVYTSTVAVESSTLAAGNGGAGGAGAAGQRGQGGGAGEMSSTAYCFGRPGGNGAGGSGGGGGAGGLSAAIVSVGSTLNVDAPTEARFQTGVAGVGGSAGAPAPGGTNSAGTGVSGAAGTRGIDGTKATTLVL